MFITLFYISSVIFLLGLSYKLSTWLSRKISIASESIAISVRIKKGMSGILKIVFSSKILLIFKAFALDVLLQNRLLKQDYLRWLMHILIFVGFTALLVMHAFDDLITNVLFDEYYSTINPFLFLRNVFGMMAIAGLAIAIYRRFIKKTARFKTNSADYYAIAILTIIMISGMLLEATKITSYTEFDNMVENWSAIDDQDEIQALESLWVKDFGVVSPNVKKPFDLEILELGKEVHEANCMECHSPAKWAFTGYTFAKIINPIALTLDKINFAKFLWYIHILACFIGLAYLPFSKMFHIISSPVSLLVNAVMENGKSDPANIATRQIMELDACVHCCICSLNCSAAMAYEAIGNEYILPSEKMISLKALSAGKSLDEKELRAIQQGVYFCTNCDRCTVVCPVGIDLKTLWTNARESLLLLQKHIEPSILSQLSFVRGLNKNTMSQDQYNAPIDKAKRAIAGDFDLLMDFNKSLTLNKKNTNDRPSDDTFSCCFECKNCTTICPVVNNYDNPEQELGLLPHQIMRCLALGLVEMASGANMIWNCLTCYQCQESCPQNVKITDIFYDLKNIAVRKKQ